MASSDIDIAAIVNNIFFTILISSLFISDSWF